MAPLLHRAAITSGQSKLTKGHITRIAAAHGRFNRIR